MMYKNDFVASIKVAGKILREYNTNDSPTVYLPFGSEFSILLKNLKSRKASVKISIDGKDVLNGGSLILNGNDSLELERFLKDLNVGNKFKFIEKTQEISDFRGDRIDDGIVRIEYRYELEKPQPSPWYYGGGLLRSCDNDNTVYGSGVSRICDNRVDGLHSTRRINVGDSITSTCFSSSVFGDNVASAATPTAYLNNVSHQKNTDGITVAGSESKQKFTEGHIGALEYQSYVITLQLKGGSAPVTVNTKVQCPTCGKLNKSNNKFCSNCGTAVNII